MTADETDELSLLFRSSFIFSCTVRQSITIQNIQQSLYCMSHVTQTAMSLTLRSCGRPSHHVFRSIVGSRTLVSSMSFEGIEKAAARHAASHFIKTMDNNCSHIDIPTICVSDPANIGSWEWSANLDSKPKLTRDEISKMSKSCTFDAFQLVEKDISTLSGMFCTV